MVDPSRPNGSSASRPGRSAGKGHQDYRVGWQMAGLGWEFVSYVLAGMLLGWGIDWAWSVAPWGIVGGTVAGLLVGMWTFLKRALKLNAEQGPVQRPPGGWREVPDDEPKPDPDSADDRGQGRQP